MAGVARLLRRAAELAWTQADAAGPRSSRQLLALGIDAAADEASGLLPRRARLDGPTPVGDNPAELLASAEQLLRRICVVGAPSRLLGLRALVAELVWEANTGADSLTSARSASYSPIAMRSRARRCYTPSHGPAMVRAWGRWSNQRLNCGRSSRPHRWLRPPGRI